MFGNLSLATIAVYIVCILIAMAVHEFMHAYVGYKLGDSTAHDEGRLSLNPLRHVDPLLTVALPVATIVFFGVPILAAKPVPFNPANVKYEEFGAAMIAAAGPFSNLALAFAGALFAQFMAAGSLADQVLQIFISLNVALFVFNLLPIPPLDGSRVLYAFAPKPLQDFLEMVEPFGFFIIIALVVMGGFGGVLVTLNEFVLNFLP
jgi:Zn-dependent protease